MNNTTAQGGMSTGTIILGVTFTVAVVGLGIYLVNRRSSAPALQQYPSPNANTPIPGVEPNAGAQAAGILTDPNFFNGLRGLATDIANLVKENKKGTSTSTTSPIGPNYLTQAEHEATAPWLSGRPSWADSGKKLGF
jgi:hypothetical protein